MSRRKRYTDEKGRTRWVRNDEVAVVVKQLGEYLIIGGYPEDHAKRYGQLAHAISRWPESVDVLVKKDELGSIPGVGGVIADYLRQIIDTGTTDKFNDKQYGKPPPKTVLELTAIPRLGPKTAKLLYTEHGVDSLQKLCKKLAKGELDNIKGFGPKLRTTIKDLCDKNKL